MQSEVILLLVKVLSRRLYFDDSRQEYKNIRTVKWLQISEWEHPGKSVAKRLTDITPYTDYIEKLITIFTPDELDDVDTQPEVDYPEYSSADFLSDVYMSEQDYETLVNVLKMKKISFYRVHLVLEKHLLPNVLPILLLVQKS